MFAHLHGKFFSKSQEQHVPARSKSDLNLRTSDVESHWDCAVCKTKKENEVTLFCCNWCAQWCHESCSGEKEIRVSDDASNNYARMCNFCAEIAECARAIKMGECVTCHKLVTHKSLFCCDSCHKMYDRTHTTRKSHWNIAMESLANQKDLFTMPKFLGMKSKAVENTKDTKKEMYGAMYIIFLSFCIALLIMQIKDFPASSTMATSSRSDYGQENVCIFYLSCLWNGMNFDSEIGIYHDIASSTELTVYSEPNDTCKSLLNETAEFNPRNLNLNLGTRIRIPDPQASHLKNIYISFQEMTLAFVLVCIGFLVISKMLIFYTNPWKISATYLKQFYRFFCYVVMDTFSAITTVSTFTTVCKLHLTRRISKLQDKFRKTETMTKGDQKIETARTSLSIKAQVDAIGKNNVWLPTSGQVINILLDGDFSSIYSKLNPVQKRVLKIRFKEALLDITEPLRNETKRPERPVGRVVPFKHVSPKDRPVDLRAAAPVGNPQRNGQNVQGINQQAPRDFSGHAEPHYVHVEHMIQDEDELNVPYIHYYPIPPQPTHVVPYVYTYEEMLAQSNEESVRLVGRWLLQAIYAFHRELAPNIVYYMQNRQDWHQLYYWLHNPYFLRERVFEYTRFVQDMGDLDQFQNYNTIINEDMIRHQVQDLNARYEQSYDHPNRFLRQLHPQVQQPQLVVEGNRYQRTIEEELAYQEITDLFSDDNIFMRLVARTEPPESVRPGGRPRPVFPVEHPGGTYRGGRPIPQEVVTEENVLSANGQARRPGPIVPSDYRERHAMIARLIGREGEQHNDFPGHAEAYRIAEEEDRRFRRHERRNRAARLQADNLSRRSRIHNEPPIVSNHVERQQLVLDGLDNSDEDYDIVPNAPVVWDNSMMRPPSEHSSAQRTVNEGRQPNALPATSQQRNARRTDNREQTEKNPTAKVEESPYNHLQKVQQSHQVPQSQQRSGNESLEDCLHRIFSGVPEPNPASTERPTHIAKRRKKDQEVIGVRKIHIPEEQASRTGSLGKKEDISTPAVELGKEEQEPILEDITASIEPLTFAAKPVDASRLEDNVAPKVQPTPSASLEKSEQETISDVISAANVQPMPVANLGMKEQEPILGDNIPAPEVQSTRSAKLGKKEQETILEEIFAAETSEDENNIFRRYLLPLLEKLYPDETQDMLEQILKLLLPLDNSELLLMVDDEDFLKSMAVRAKQVLAGHAVNFPDDDMATGNSEVMYNTESDSIGT